MRYFLWGSRCYNCVKNNDFEKNLKISWFLHRSRTESVVWRCLNPLIQVLLHHGNDSWSTRINTNGVCDQDWNIREPKPSIPQNRSLRVPIQKIRVSAESWDSRSEKSPAGVEGAAAPRKILGILKTGLLIEMALLSWFSWKCYRFSELKLCIFWKIHGTLFQILVWLRSYRIW